MKLQDFNILYLNLDHRNDRLKWIQNELNRLNLLHRQNKITKRISGVNGQQLSNEVYAKKIAKEFGVPVEKMIADYWLSRKNFKTMCKAKTKILGKVGCTLGHLRAIKYVQQHKLYPALILEDDCLFLAKNNTTIRFPKPPADSELFYLGGLFWHQVNPPPFVPKSTRWLKIDPKKLKLPCAYAYGFTKPSQVDNIVNLITCVWKDGKGRDKPIDWRTGEERIRMSIIDIQFVNYVQGYGTAYVLHPVRAIQSADFTSDVTNFGGITPKNPYKHKYFYDDKEEEEAKKKYFS